MNQYIKRIWASLRQDSVVTIINILGTALAIFLIMIMVLMQEVKVLPFSPESNRDRFLIADAFAVEKLDKQGMFAGGFSESSAKQLYSSLKTPEAVTLFASGNGSCLLSADNANPVSVDQKQTDASFWRVFDFDFISGKPYDQAAFNAKQKVLVLSEGVARHLFHSVNVVGRTVEMNYTPYTICGVVRDVSSLATLAYSQIWLPYSTTNIVSNTGGIDDVQGNGLFKAVALASSKSDLPKIIQEYKKSAAAFNSQLKSHGMKITDNGRPYGIFDCSLGAFSNQKPDPKKFYIREGLIFLILLLVPAINLSSMTQSRLRRYITEIGIRRAFGCRRSRMLTDIVTENFILTLAAGCIGLLFCYLFTYFNSDLVFANITDYFFNSNGHHSVNFSLLFSPTVFLFALLFCFLLNLLSSIIPAWQASRTNIVNALNGRTR